MSLNINKLFGIIFVVMLFVDLVFADVADVKLNATGYEWVKYSHREKGALVALLLNSHGIKRSAEAGIRALDFYYFTAIRDGENESGEDAQAQRVLGVPCDSVITEALKFFDRYFKTEVCKGEEYYVFKEMADDAESTRP